MSEFKKKISQSAEPKIFGDNKNDSAKFPAGECPCGTQGLLNFMTDNENGDVFLWCDKCPFEYANLEEAKKLNQTNEIHNINKCHSSTLNEIKAKGFEKDIDLETSDIDNKIIIKVDGDELTTDVDFVAYMYKLLRGQLFLSKMELEGCNFGELFYHTFLCYIDIIFVFEVYNLSKLEANVSGFLLDEVLYASDCYVNALVMIK